MEQPASLDCYTASTRHSGLYYDVTLTSYESQAMEEDFEDCHAVISASAPSSLNFDYNSNSTGTKSAQVKTGPIRTTKATKPKTLPLFKKSKSHCIQTKKEKLEYELKREKPHLSSMSLPNTPISQSKNHLPAPTQSPLPQRAHHHSLQFSPCGMAATLGSRSETCLNYFHTPLAESMQCQMLVCWCAHTYLCLCSCNVTSITSSKPEKITLHPKVNTHGLIIISLTICISHNEVTISAAPGDNKNRESCDHHGYSLRPASENDMM